MVVREVFQLLLHRLGSKLVPSHRANLAQVLVKVVDAIVPFL